ncbi:MAG: nucleotidyltransferase domain-containing protein, partial [Gemmatimonadaceae bacterium]
MSTPVSIFLQGSYRNATNIYGDSDIDVVVLHENIFYHNKHELPPDQQLAHDSHFVVASYDWKQLHADTLSTLTRAFPHGAVRAGNKSIKVKTGIGGMEADVVPAMQYRGYAHFRHPEDLLAHWG